MFFSFIRGHGFLFLPSLLSRPSMMLPDVFLKNSAMGLSDPPFWLGFPPIDPTLAMAFKPFMILCPVNAPLAVPTPGIMEPTAAPPAAANPWPVSPVRFFILPKSPKPLCLTAPWCPG